ncbi:NUDIX hydrolase [Pseudooctadecabacter jejudonensis]|nr:NUDIX hydrolase [Pseudooctadecabacter jejudonensis]
MKPIGAREIELGGAAKTELRTQFAALCYRVNSSGKLRFCLVTSRRSGRWIVPKGWPMDGQTPADAAATEAYEEAGVSGKIAPHPVGVFSYYKVRSEDELPCMAVVYPLKVKKVHRKWPEKKERERTWVSRKKAVAMISDPELRQIIERFDPA